jgi:hypothetical protein
MAAALAVPPATVLDGVHRDFELELHVAHTTQYPLCEDDHARAAA